VNTLFQAGARVQQRFERHGWKFCFIGGVANFRWGTPRLTNHLDLTLLTGLRTCSAEDLIVHKAFAGAPELLTELARIATRAEAVVGPFPHARP
jgi:hypothetical protein